MQEIARLTHDLNNELEVAFRAARGLAAAGPEEMYDRARALYQALDKARTSAQRLCTAMTVVRVIERCRKEPTPTD